MWILNFFRGNRTKQTTSTSHPQQGMSGRDVSSGKTIPKVNAKKDGIFKSFYRSIFDRKAYVTEKYVAAGEALDKVKGIIPGTGVLSHALDPNDPELQKAQKEFKKWEEKYNKLR